MAVIMGFFIVFLGLAFGAVVVYTSSLIQAWQAPELIPLQLESIRENTAERKLFNALTLHGYMVYTQYRIGKYQSDLFIPPHILIDFTGASHQQDKKKYDYFRKRGYRVILLSRSGINRDTGRIIQRIGKELTIRKINQ